MSVNLQKGQKVDLTKGNASLRKVIVGLGWDEVKVKRGLFGGKAADIDCDAAAILLGPDGKLISRQVMASQNQLNSDVVFFGNLEHSSRCVKHLGDNLTGAGAGDDEQIVVHLLDLPKTYERVVFVVNIYQAIERKQHFGLIENAFIRIVDADTNTELCKYNLSENYTNMTAMAFGELYRHGGEWKFNAVGSGFSDTGIAQTVSRYV